MRVLDLGCGDVKVDKAIGLDRVLLPGVDVVADLADPRFPFADDTFDEIYLNDVIEHLPDTIATMEALFRIAKPESRIFIRVVNWNCHYTAMDPTHLKAFTQNTFDFFGAHPRSYYTKARFEVLRCDLQYNASVEKRLRYNKRLLKFLSTYLCNILEGLNFELKTVKPARAAAPKSDDGTLDSILRCPHCAALRVRKHGAATGKLVKVGIGWLACSEDACQRKYPVVNGVPVLLAKEADQWSRTPAHELPSELPSDLDWIKPLASHGPVSA